MTDRGRDAAPPPDGVQRRLRAGEEPQPDLGLWRVQCLTEKAAAAIGDAHDARLLVRLLGHVSAIDPGVSLLPALGTACRDLHGRGRHRSGLNFAASLRYVCLSAPGALAV